MPKFVVFLFICLGLSIASAQSANPIRLAIPGVVENSEDAQRISSELKVLFPDVAFSLLAAASDDEAVQMVIDDMADIAETDAAGVIGKYG